jgi:poly(3-hydroxybutyrate) depolymerase
MRPSRFAILLCLAPAGPACAGPVEDLDAWLKQGRGTRPALETQGFATAPLSAAESEAARQLIWAERTAWVKSEWGAQWTGKRLAIGGLQMRFDYRVYGAKPAAGYDFYISMHGGGDAAASVNDQQWQNQIILYQPPGVYLAPRAPTDAWNMWHRDHIDAFFDRLIHLAVAYQEVNPERVYLMGYSAGGDGAYQMIPRMADRWAAGAMMAGYPNAASPVNLRNIGMTLHVGGQDAAYDRNTLAVDFGKRIQKLQDADPGFYKYQVKVYPDKGHWMDQLDSEAVPWMRAFTRVPHPKKVVWLQDTTVGSPIAATDPKVKDPPVQWRFHWVGRPDRKTAPRQGSITASIQGQDVRVEQTNLDSVEIGLNDKLLDLSLPVAFYWKGAKVHEGPVPRTALALYRSVDARGDRELIYPARVVLTGKGLTGLARRAEARPAFRAAWSRGRLRVVLDGAAGPGEVRVRDLRGRVALRARFRGAADLPAAGLGRGLWLIEAEAAGMRRTQRLAIP